MPERVQSLRSSITGARPAPGSRQVGEIFTNFADFQLGIIDVTKAPQDLVAVRYFSAAANYAVGDFVIQAGTGYRAKVPIVAAAFNPAQWDTIATSIDLSGKEPTIAPGTIAQYWRGDKSWQTLDKAAVGLANVDNTSDANKPVSTAAAAADSARVLKVGDVMTGHLTLPAGPGAAQAVRRDYVDAADAALSSAIGGKLGDAASDGQAYGRKNAAWVDVAEEAPNDGVAYARQSGGWVSTAAGITEAPLDNKPYARQSTGGAPGWNDLTDDFAAKAPLAALTNTLSVDATTDYDTLTTAGFSTILLGTGNPHAPTAGSGDYYLCETLVAFGNLTQIAWPYGLASSIAKGIWWRGRYSGVWSAWQSVLDGAPIGSILYVPATAAPANYIKLNGSLLSRTTYAALFAYANASGNLVTDAVWMGGSTGAFSTGNGSTDFRIPDDRGAFARGWDDGRGLDTGRLIGAYQADAFQSHTHDVTTVATQTGGSSNAIAVRASSGSSPATFSISPSSGNVGTETRPRNNARLACIRYQ